MHPVQGTISIVSHGHGPLVVNLLQDLARQREIERWLVIVTLNIPEPFEPVPGLRMTVIHNNAPKGFGANHNAASVKAEGALYAIVNPDIRVEDDRFLQRLGMLDWEDGMPLRAPIVVAPSGTEEDSVRRNLSIPNLFARRHRRSSGWEADPASSEFFWLAGMFLIAPIVRFRALSGFDDRYRLYCEDYDLCARWRIAGGRVELIRDLRVIHDARRDSHRSMRHLRWHIASLLRVWRSAPFWRIVAGRY
ncbi:glycosyltransferase family 2 protein [Sphingomonas carotinifaciens]|uniref:glycosyltransferase family 2 protein n=1 Tax=Sphingomonas carotinifaciens TaxID=1166323 RepID=UPI0012377937|nr:glycosyltransferase family 2 protein [Sphingomonas carotinifaciens]